MTEADMLFSVTVPGSTANLGPGFDSVGMALSRYLRLSVFLMMSGVLRLKQKS